MKKVVRLFFTALFALLLAAPQSRAQGDAAALLPFLEDFKGSVVYQMIQEAMSAEEYFQQKLKEYDKQTEMTDWIASQFTKAEDVLKIANNVDRIYQNNKTLLSTCIYSYDWMKEELERGNITPYDFVRLSMLLEYVYQASQSNLKDILALLKDTKNGVTNDKKLEEAAKASEVSGVAAKALEAQIDEEKQKIKEKHAGEAFHNYLSALITSSEKYSDIYIPTKKEVRELLDKNEEESEDEEVVKYEINSDKGTEARALTSKLSSSKESILNLVSFIVGILAIIMAIPAYLKVTKGEQQSKDTLYKLIMGTIAIVVIIQVFGRFFLSLF